MLLMYMGLNDDVDFFFGFMMAIICMMVEMVTLKDARCQC